jgi:hypothetical protein
VQVIGETYGRRAEADYGSCEDDKSPQIERFLLGIFHLPVASTIAAFFLIVENEVSNNLSDLAYYVYNAHNMQDRWTSQENICIIHA